ncbi:hypothetical protein [Benzoatithermus flavus]|uniref:Uncharacterized protein n=1 Tax=Benzoatithermus flavus TaxID=3108223 RepID=A0ABU8XS68_9PROT
MARQIRSGRARPLPIRPAAPGIRDERILTELAGLRTALAGLEQKLAAPPPETRALGQALDGLRRRLEELAAGRHRQERRLDEIARHATARFGRRLARGLVPIRTLLARLGPKAAEPAAPPAPSLLTGAGRTVLALLLGLSEEEQAALADRLAAAPPFPGLVPVFVTDRTAFAPFRRRGAFFEHLPQPRDPDGRDWELYRIRRFGILCRKWQPLRVVAFGREARQWLAAIADSPHLAEEARALLRSAATDAGARRAPTGR